MARKLPELRELSDAALVKLQDEINEERTAVRLQQNEITAEIEFRQMTARMSGSTREKFLAMIQVGGAVAPSGEAQAVTE